MKDVEQRAAAKSFARDWKGKGYEKGDTHSFWISFLQDVMGVERATNYVEFEKEVIIGGNTKFVDVYIPDTKVVIEQKSLEKSLSKPAKQSDGSVLTPFEQAKNYANYLPADEYPKWIITCNFGEFQIYNMNKPGEAPTKILLSELPKRYSEFSFLVDEKKDYLKHEMEVSIKAGELVGKIYDAFLELYPDKEDPHYLHSLNVLCVRLVFCLYAEDAGIFGRRDMFHDYLNSFKPENMRMGLVELFRVLDTEPDKRDPFANPKLLEFPYVNGGLFSTEEDIAIPPITEEIRGLLLERASLGFDWSDISPTIFGAVFESTLNPETRRSGGMHYTSIENIHKVIDPLFLDDLKAELTEIKEIQVVKTKEKRLRAYQEKLASLTFMDPAAGSGNFLTETYLCLRRLENQVILELTKGQIVLGTGSFNPVKVSIQQFYGIEINDFAVTVAKSALWIAESQMLKETEDIVHMVIDFLPLKTYVNMIEGNAVTKDWNEVVPKAKLNYIMGNPPFIGARMMDQGSPQKREVENLFGKIKDVQDLDYVTCWYRKAAEYIQGTSIEVGLVATNSICQGAQVPILWDVLLNQFGVEINYAYRTFKWTSETKNTAAVFCVIIGFAVFARKKKYIYTDSGDGESTVRTQASNISPYLIDAPNSFVVAAKDTLCGTPKMNFGNQPRDGGHFVLSVEEKERILSHEPALQKWIHPYIGAEEFIKGKERYCLWLKDASPTDIIHSKILSEKVAAVREFRETSKAKTTRGYAKVAQQFAQITQPDGVDYLMIPSVSSERRRYIPIGFVHSDTVSSNAVQIIPNATLYHFGVLTSNVHMAWMRTVAGRLEMRYRYSKEIVYNTFPWPSPSEEQVQKIEKTAQAILDARANYPESTMADFYSNLDLFADLKAAHIANDRAVWEAYGKAWDITSESDCVAHLMKMYQKLCKE